MLNKIILLVSLGTIIIRLKRFLEIETENIDWTVEYMTDNYNSDIEDYLEI